MKPFQKHIFFLLLLALLIPLSACTADNSTSHEKQAEEFMKLAFDCPNEEIIGAATTTDGSYIAEGSFVSGSGETLEDKFKVIFQDYVTEDCIQKIIAVQYVGMNHIYAAENGTASKFESLNLEETTSENQYSFTLQLLCMKSDSGETPVELSGSIRFNSKNKIEMLKFSSGYDTYMKTLSE